MKEKLNKILKNHETNRELRDAIYHFKEKLLDLYREYADIVVNHIFETKNKIKPYKDHFEKEQRKIIDKMNNVIANHLGGDYNDNYKIKYDDLILGDFDAISDINTGKH